MIIKWDQALQDEIKVAQIIQKQEERGVLLDLSKCHGYVDELEEIKGSLYDNIRPHLTYNVIVQEGKFQEETEKCNMTFYKGDYNFVSKIFNKDRSPSRSVVAFLESLPVGDSLKVDQIGGPFSRIYFEEPVLTKRQKLAKQLLRFGWEPELFTPTGQPKLTDKGQPVDSLLRIEGDVGKNLASWFIHNHRQGQISGWIRDSRENGSIPASADTCGTNTVRFKHRVVANVPKASPRVIFGREMRSCFIPRPGYAMLGCDAAGLEARVLAHYTFPYDDGELGDEILHGDIHTKNSNNLSIDRDSAKTLYYALMYGAQWGKVKSILNCSSKRAKEVFNQFWKSMGALGHLRDKVIKVHKKYGYLPGLDGRKVYTRSDHSALNTLFQSAGAIAVKRATVLMDQEIKERDWDVHQIIHYHDEYQFEIPYDLVECDERGELVSEVGEVAANCFTRSGEFYEMRVPLTGDYKIGNNWAQTH